MINDLRIAAVVCRCPVGALTRNLERTRHWTVQAARQGAGLVCFPEMNLTGYSNRALIKEHAIRCDGPQIDTLKRLAAQENVMLLVGFAEKDDAGRLYASHMTIAPNGRTGVYRKLHLAPPEADHFTAGDRLPLFSWGGLRFGIQLCYDAHFPEIATCMATAGADALFIPHASPRGQAPDKHQSWLRHLPARAYDNAIFVVACNQTGDNGSGLNFPGNAVTVSPSGEVMDSYLSGMSGMLVADLTCAQIKHVRGHRMRYFFPNRRPTLYRESARLNRLDQ